MPKMTNPPSIPSHKNAFGYDEDEYGHLVKQSASSVGFSGIKHDRVGPGDYDVDNSKGLVSRNVKGVTTWRKKHTQPAIIQSIIE